MNEDVRRRDVRAARRACVVAVLAGGGLFGSLFLAWFHYDTDFAHEFDTKGWIVFTNMDIHLAITGGLGVALGLVGLFGLRRLVASVLAIGSLLALGLIVYRLVARPYAENFVSVSPRIGAGVALVSALLLLGASLRIHRLGRALRPVARALGGSASRGATFVTTRLCPHCGKVIPGWRRTCPYCEREVGAEQR